MKKPVCYISYCQEDIAPENMEIIVKWMSGICNDKIEFLFDKAVKYNDSFIEFERKIFSSDAIIIFFSREYKQRCLDDKDTGVAREYRKILNVHENNNKTLYNSVTINSNYFDERKLVYRVLFKGNPDISIPDEMQDYKYLDASKHSKFCENSEHEVVITNSFKEKFENSFTDILNEIITTSTEKTPQFIRDYDNIFRDLFINTKSEHFDLPSELFVEIDAYHKIISQQKYLVIGRKGSGKTTVKNTISSITGEDYKGIISIIADQFSIEETYERLVNNDQLYSDVHYMFSYSDTYDILWYSFVILYCVFVVYKEYLSGKMTNIEQNKHIFSLKNIIEYIFQDIDICEINDDEQITKTLYFYTLSNLVEFIKDLAKNGSNDTHLYEVSIKANYTKKNFLNILLRNKKCYRDLCDILKYCHKKIFITLDGFDVRYELFKKTTVRLSKEEEKNKRTTFEAEWLMSFLETLIELKAASDLKDVIDLCLTLPVDRLEEIKGINRDFYKYHAYTIGLNWKASDLLKVIIQRLRKINNLELENKVCTEAELDLIMKQFYPNLPSNIQLERDGYVNDMPLFLYILRKSFWRPRDIIRYYCCILSLSKNQDKIDNISIKRAIKDESLRIIQDEFFGEFSNLYTNLKDVISLFELSKQVLSYNEMYNILKNSAIIVDGNIRKDDFIQKIKILYIIGFLGIKIDKVLKESQYLFDDYAFVFTEGTSLLRLFENKTITNYEFVIHPIFAEYLFMKVDYNNLICNYTWNYVYKINNNNIDYIMDE